MNGLFFCFPPTPPALPRTRRALTCPLASLSRLHSKWADAMRATRPDYFERLVATQAPEFLWIGCADSRVPVRFFLCVSEAVCVRVGGFLFSAARLAVATL